MSNGASTSQSTPLIIGLVMGVTIAVFIYPTITALLAVGESPRDETIDAAQHAAMTIVTSMILNLDETLMRG